MLSVSSHGLRSDLCPPYIDLGLTYIVPIFATVKRSDASFTITPFKRSIKGQQQGIAVQQAGREYQFLTQMRFENLTLAELGTILVILGQDPCYPIALKVGGGKPIGMGTMTVEVTANRSFRSHGLTATLL
jgi:hypothetical protein